MRFEIVRSSAAANNSAAVRRLIAGGTRWRVLVDAWREDDGWRGYLVFEPDETAPLAQTRLGPPMLRGRSRAEVVSAAHEVSEEHLLKLLRSLG